MGNGNGILDLETINNELMEQRNVNTRPESSAVLNAENMMNSETANPAMPAPTAIEPANPVMPAPTTIEAASPVMPAPTTIEPVNPTMSDFSDLEIQDNSQNFDQPTTPETIDSRSFTHTPAEWKRIQEEEANNYADSADSVDNYNESKPQNFFQVYFALLASLILAGAFVLVIIKFYNIEYISTSQGMICIMPAMGLFYGFYYMTGKRKMTIPMGILLIVLNEFISYFMFQAVMVHGVREMYAELSFKEAWQFVNIMKKISETKELYYTHFFIIFGLGSLVGIIFGVYGMGGILDPNVRRRRRRY